MVPFSGAGAVLASTLPGCTNLANPFGIVGAVVVERRLSVPEFNCLLASTCLNPCSESLRSVLRGIATTLCELLRVALSATRDNLSA